MKAILVMDMPKDCDECNLFAFGCCYATFPRQDIDKECISQIKKPSWCPLRPYDEGFVERAIRNYKGETE